jgi:hypothetical protein
LCANKNPSGYDQGLTEETYAGGYFPLCLATPAVFGRGIGVAARSITEVPGRPLIRVTSGE